jgi:GNAT superfamily N-acetyltransferase
MSDVTIIRATTEHLDALVPLFDAYRVFYRAEPEPERAHAFLKERLERDESVIFLATIDGEAVGFTQLYPLFGSIVMQRIWLLNDLFVAPQARKHGVGRALLERAKQFGQEVGAQRLELRTEVTNLTAQSVYEGHGWTRETDFYSYRLYL